MASVSENCRSILARIEAAAARSAFQERGPVTLVSVSKRQELSKMQELIDSDLFAEGPVFGENFVQEYAEKKPGLKGSFSTHCIGGLQSNKAKKAVELFDCIETVDSLKLARLLDKESKKIGKRLACFLQVNISLDEAKRGFLPQDLKSGCFAELLAFSSLDIRGLMTITRFYEEPESARPDFAALRVLRDSLEQQYAPGTPLLLSMGMSADFEVAIEEGANIVRVGSALFGERVY